jgi:hypothetical protein
LAALVALAGCGEVKLPERDWRESGDPLGNWAAVLNAYVDDVGRVDFAGLAGDPDALLYYLNYVAEVSPRSHPEQFPTRQGTLAYYINAYNALAMFNVIDSGIPGSLAGLRKIQFFFLKRLRVGGIWISLYGLENDVIRPLGDARMHFALNCMAVSCPRLPREPFTAEGLDRQLDREAKYFFTEGRNLRIDPENKAITVSEILDFYEEDFTAQEGFLTAYIDRYTEESVLRDFVVGFFDYDWTVNQQP